MAPKLSPRGIFFESFAPRYMPAFFSAAGYEVTEAANGRIGLERYRQKPTDLVITDILMPELNGLDMLLELTREFLNAKVIAISGVGGEKNVLDIAKLLGARRTFEKPFSIPRLLDVVRYELEH